MSSLIAKILKKFKINNKIRATKSVNFNKDINLKELSLSFKELKLKGGLLRKLVFTFSLLLIFSSLISGVATFIITKNKVTEDFKMSTVQILNDNKKFVQTMNANVDAMIYQTATNEQILSIINNPPTDSFVLSKRRMELETLFKNIADSSSTNK